MSLYQTYRPKSFEDVVGNELTVKTLQSDLSKKDPPHAFLLTGPTGCGKTTLARIIGRELGAVGDDFVEVDSADFRGIDTIREIRHQSLFKPLHGGKARVWLTDEVHKLTNDAQNAFLKALEDSPSHVYYILATTDPQKLIPTIKGRCSQYSVSMLGEKDMMVLLRRVVRMEEKSISREIYEQIVQDSEGLPRNALQILDSVLAADPSLQLDIAKKAAEKQSTVVQLCRALMENSGWKRVKTILGEIQKAGEEDAESIRRAVLGYCTSVLLRQDEGVDKAGIVMDEFIEPFYDSGWPGLVFACYRIVRGV